MKNTILTLALVSAIAGMSNAAFAGSCGKCKKECDKEAVKEKECCGKCDKSAKPEGEPAPAPAPEAPKAP